MVFHQEIIQGKKLNLDESVLVELYRCELNLRVEIFGSSGGGWMEVELRVMLLSTWWLL